MRVLYTPRFIKMVRSLSKDLQEEVYEKVELFRDPAHHVGLKVHKLQGSMKGLSSFSVNYRIRIVFERVQDGVILHAVGDHDVYR